MILGTVTGQVWATRKAGRLVGHKLLVVKPSRSFRLGTDHVIAIDQVGAEVGQQVLVCMGAAGRWQTGDDRTPTDAAICAIVDGVTP